MAEVVIVVICLLAGVVAYGDEVGLRRGTPAFFRAGPVVVREQVPLAVLPDHLPDPVVAAPWYRRRSSIWRLGPGEVAFTAEWATSPVLKAVLTVDPEQSALVVTARPFWGTVPLFLIPGVVMLALGQAMGVVWLGLLLLFVAVCYRAEVREIRAVLTRTAQQAGGSK